MGLVLLQNRVINMLQGNKGGQQGNKVKGNKHVMYQLLYS